MMKTKKNKLTNIFKLGIILFGISLLLFNCKKDNEIIKPFNASINNNKLDYTLEKIGYSELLSDQEIKKTLPHIQHQFSNSKKRKNQSNKTTQVSEYFSIITDRIHKITTEDAITWTFKIETPILKNSDFENFLVKKHNEEFSYFLVSYVKDLETVYKKASLYPISQEFLNLDNLDLTSKGEYFMDDEDFMGGGGLGVNCEGIIHTEIEPCNQGGFHAAKYWCQHFGSVHGGGNARPCDFTCSGTNMVTIIDFSHCNNESVIDFNDVPDYGSSDSNNTQNGNSGLSNNGGSSSSGGTTITNPVTLECDNCSDSLTLTSYLNLTEQSQIDWVNDIRNENTVANLLKFGNENQWNENTTTISLQVLNTLSNTNNSSLSFEENKLVNNKAIEIFDIITKNNFSNINHYSTADQKIIAQNSLFIGFLPSINSTIGEYWPKNDEERAIIGELFSQFLPELALGFIPGSDIIEIIKGVDNGDTVAVAFGLNGLIVDAFGGTILKGLTKAIKIGKKVFTSFKLTYKFINVIGKALKTGLKVSLEGTTVILKKNGNEIARISNNVMNFKYSGYGGNIITNPNKTTTLIGKWDGQLENIWNTGLAKQGNNSGGLNVLGNVQGSTIAEKWADNKRWLNEAINRGDVIRATANPLNISNVFYDLDNIPTSVFSNINTLKSYLLSLTPQEISQLGYFGREIRHLFQNGYNFNSTLNQFIL